MQDNQFTQTLTMKLERANFFEVFHLIEQKVFTTINIKPQTFRAIEHQVNKHCKDLEAFTITVVVNVEPYMYFTQTHNELTYKATLTKVLNFDGDNLIKEPLEV